VQNVSRGQNFGFGVRVLYKGTWTPLAVKTEKGDLQPGEEHARWPLVRSEEQALSAIGARLK